MNGFVKLKITGNNLNINEITDNLKRTPDFLYKKGDVYKDKMIKDRTIIYEEDCWLAEVMKDKEETIEECIEKFVLEFCHVSNYLKKLASSFNVILWVSVYPENEQLYFHLSKKTIEVLNEIGISVDFNIAFLKEFYLESQKEP